MKTLLTSIVAVVAVACSSQKNTTAVPTDIVAPGAKPVMVSDQFNFTEGPAVDKHGNVFFTDQPNNRIWEYDTDGKLTLFMENTGRSNGMYFDSKGNLISCADEQNQIISIAPNKTVKVLLTDFEGKRLNGPNDLWVSPNDDIYFTDPLYKRPWWTRPMPEIKPERVYYLPKNSSRPVVVAEGLVKPNGIIGTPDGKTLYVADIADNKTYRFSVGNDGKLSNQTLFAGLGSDGMTIDKLGNVYMTGKGVTVYNPQGTMIKHIDIPQGWTANVCFGGKNKDVLFITASKAVYTLQMQVKGVQ